MVGSDQIIIDEFEMGIHLMRNRRDFSRCVCYRCESFDLCSSEWTLWWCEMDDLSQLHHNCLTMEVEEAWATHLWTREGKSGLTKIMEACRGGNRNKLNLQLKETWLKSLVHLCKMDTKAVYLLYMDFLRRDECYQLMSTCSYLRCVWERVLDVISPE